MNILTIEELAVDVTDLFVRDVEARTRGDLPRETTAQLLLALIRAVIMEEAAKAAGRGYWVLPSQVIPKGEE